MTLNVFITTQKEMRDLDGAFFTVCYYFLPCSSGSIRRQRCTCFSLQSSTPSSISCCLSCKPSSRAFIWYSTSALSLWPRFLEQSEAEHAQSRHYRRKRRPPLLRSLKWCGPIFKDPQCSRNPNGKIEE